jgi:hypothetical protein
MLVDLSSEGVFEVSRLQTQLVFNSVIDELGQVPLLPVRELSLVEGSDRVLDVWVLEG